ncbi:DUF2259 domain-containing protein [Stappia indica]|uniref:DUF2259 domain-containing protein n=1 Tax=Stappia indica TaxID=538381 RepID=UPI001D192050|nr:DUF2259 domain-containing protein [Stappia indica]MCC4243292.1 DUF2259 domain-containing protein [Stappia indica]
MRHLTPKARTLAAAPLAATAFALLVSLGTTPAFAGDYARVDVMGFSANGNRFAFEEYGTQDGSGFPYSNIYLFDVDRDAWLGNSPFRRLDETGDATPTQAQAALERTRAANRDKALDLIVSAGIVGAGDMVAHNPPTERGADPHLMIASMRPEVPAFGPQVELRLTEHAVERPARCPDGFGEIKGFRLTLTLEGQTRVLNDDARLPQSRGCALGYRIERLVVHHPVNGGPASFAVIVLVEQVGFEGPDGRHLAITGRL